MAGIKTPPDPGPQFHDCGPFSFWGTFDDCVEALINRNFWWF